MTRLNPIERYRTACGLTQAALANRLGVNVNSVRAWEAGAKPRARQIPALASLFNVDPVKLVDEIEAWRQQEGKAAA